MAETAYANASGPEEGARAVVRPLVMGAAGVTAVYVVLCIAGGGTTAFGDWFLAFWVPILSLAFLALGMWATAPNTYFTKFPPAKVHFALMTGVSPLLVTYVFGGICVLHSPSGTNVAVAVVGFVLAVVNAALAFYCWQASGSPTKFERCVGSAAAVTLLYVCLAVEANPTSQKTAFGSILMFWYPLFSLLGLALPYAAQLEMLRRGHLIVGAVLSAVAAVVFGIGMVVAWKQVAGNALNIASSKFPSLVALAVDGMLVVALHGGVAFFAVKEYRSGPPAAPLFASGP